MTTETAAAGPIDLTPLLRAARRGFKSDVQKLVDALDHGYLLVPLAHAVAGLPVGENVDPEDDVSIAPHLLPGADDELFLPLFSDQDIMVTMAEHLGWQTDDQDLQFCTLPARVALDLAGQLLSEAEIAGAALNPSDEFELALHPHEVAALLQGQAIPLVGYVSEIPVGKNEKVLIAELDEAHSEKLLAAVAQCTEKVPGLQSHRLEQTFNAERDLEPHPTLTLVVTDREAIDVEALYEGIEEHFQGSLPAPGYIDVLLENATNAS